MKYAHARPTLKRDANGKDLFMWLAAATVSASRKNCRFRKDSTAIAHAASKIRSNRSADAMHASIERMLSFEPESLYLTHYGRVDDPASLAPAMHERIGPPTVDIEPANRLFRQQLRVGDEVRERHVV